MAIGPGEDHAIIDAESIERDTVAGTVKFDVLGIKESGAENDVSLNMLIGSKSVVKTITVVIPHKIAQPYPEWDGDVEPLPLAQDKTTSPSDTTVPAGSKRYTLAWIKFLPVAVVDKWNQPVGDLYAGSAITEGTVPINQTLRADSTYLDPVGIIFDAIGIVNQTTPVINPFEPDVVFDAAYWTGIVGEYLSDYYRPKRDAKNVRDVSRLVEVDGFSLLNGTGPRTATQTALKHLKIEWPPEE